ncbi:MAG: penicillin-binding protein 1C [Aquabacterium sp.]|uniref:penicillin-binding protein 1C n=1 Tax=Aquabacterium sp. TaxID=1872578 RepID=UPI0025BA1EE4|nr:penicillin-binding protein 1C [Aquabacterium sp.]MBI5925469.1 penicillin-binding protein 1C [Aquabacterium sp.]
MSLKRYSRLMPVSVAMALTGASTAVHALPSFDQVKTSYRSSDTLLLDRQGQPLQAVRTDKTALRGEWATLPQVSPALRTALLLSEDKRFYEHTGVDWQAVGAAAWGNLWNSRTRGASTVTMQLAGLMDQDLAMPQGGQQSRSVVAKIGQASTAWRLERSWRKDQILEAYLNLVGFRGEVVGISALSARLFHKYPSGLDAEEAAITAALIRSPNAPAARVADRACGVLQEQGLKPDCKTLATYTAQVLASKRNERLNADDQLAPHLGQRLLAVWPARTPRPASITTTLDARLQRFARNTLRQHLRELRDRHVEDGAVIALDNATGEVLAWVGSSGELSQAADVDGVMALRQAGSTLKPFLYQIAIEQRWLTAASILDDSPVGLTTSSGLYIPQNYDHAFKGPVSLRTALGSSLNVPAVRTLVMVTPERFAQRLTALGLPLSHNGDFYGYSLALGSAEVTLASLSNAYRALANGGQYGPWRVQAADANTTSDRQHTNAAPCNAADATHSQAPKPAPSSSAALMNPAAAYIVADVLADREARVPTFGLSNALAARYWAAVKTGTSKDMRDNWCVGFSKRYTVGVWVGNANGDPMWDVSGTTGAAPVWRAVMDELHRRHPDQQASQPPSPPKGLLQQTVHFERNLEPPRNEWFIAGTEQADIRLASQMGAARTLIHAPSDRTIFALDPDIPLQAQKIAFALVPGVSPKWSWRLDGKRLGPATNMKWAMWPGPHLLELVDASNKVMEAVRFEVRGAQVKSKTSTADVRPVRHIGKPATHAQNPSQIK